MLGCHLRIATQGRVPLAVDESARRAVVHVLARVAGLETALFGMADEHLHAVLLATRHRSGRLGQALQLALKQVLGLPLEPTWIQPLEGRRHFERLIPYLLGQVRHHGLPEHPARWSGSCFQDLVGARVVDGLELPIRLALPRFKLRTAYQAVGLPPTELQPATDQDIRRAGADRLVAAASAAVAAPTSLPGRPRVVTLARRAAAQLAQQAGLSSHDVASALGVTRRSVQKNASRPPLTNVTQAIRMRLALEDAVQWTVPVTTAW